MRRTFRIRRPLSSKSSSCTEELFVDAAGISVKVGVHYPGRSVYLLKATAIERWQDGWTEVSRRHSRSIDQTEGLNM
jgi:hypothetical protein